MTIQEIRNVIITEVARLSGDKNIDLDEDIFYKNNICVNVV